MRIKSFQVRKTGPLKLVHVSDLANVVVLAGPNGVGKTNITTAILQLARFPQPSGSCQMVVEATDPAERADWGQSTLDTSIPNEANQLRIQLQRNQRRNKYERSFLNFDSDRAIRNTAAYQFQWDIGDPFGEDVGWESGFQPLQSRYNEVRHALFRAVEAQRREMAEAVIASQKRATNAGDKLQLDPFPDVLAPYKDAFWRLLAPKKLVEVNIKSQQIFYEIGSEQLPLESLSSGEREVVNIVFDFLTRRPRHCVIVFDEPELHLHPELSYKLLQTLSGIGDSNQFIFSTHSPEIISASLENSVIFITPPKGDDVNQAVVVHRDDETHHALQMLGQSIGVISLGKHLVLVEGQETSLDKQTYGAILKSRFPEFVLVPAGGKETLQSFDDIRTRILDKTIWGVNFYLLCDGDASIALDTHDLTEDMRKKVKFLPRYHLENYFLDERVLAKVFATMDTGNSWLTDPTAIKNKLREIALSVAPHAAALIVSARVRQAVGNASVQPKGTGSANNSAELRKLFENRAIEELGRISAALDSAVIAGQVSHEYDLLHAAVTDDKELWRSVIPGRIILNKFANAAGLSVGRLKTLYLAAADHEEIFADIVAIFDAFREAR